MQGYGGILRDYSEALIIIQELRKKAQEAAAEKKWSKVCDIADEIIDAALRLKIYCVIRGEQELEQVR